MDGVAVPPATGVGERPAVASLVDALVDVDVDAPDGLDGSA